MKVPFLSRFLPNARKASAEEAHKKFRSKYLSFLEILNSNGELLSILSDMEEKLEGNRLFSMSYVRSHSTRSLFHLQRMVNGFEALCGKAIPELHQGVTALQQELAALLRERQIQQDIPYTLGYADISLTAAEVVGGKSAHLGDLAALAGIPTPRGFAITVRGFHELMATEGLRDDILKELRAVDAADPESAVYASQSIQALLTNVSPPTALSLAISEAYDQFIAHAGKRPLVAVRSSAIGEDMELSFAGQYLTELAVPENDIASAYLRVVASLFSPRALIYRLHKGISFEESAMAVACLEMIDATAGGVMYSRQVIDQTERILINSVPGLGASAVDGVLNPDTFVLSREAIPRIVSSVISHKDMRLEVSPQGGVLEQELHGTDAEALSLAPAQAQKLASMALAIEEHFGEPQDIEWAEDREGQLLILQARPITVEDTANQHVCEPPDIPGAQVLIAGAKTAAAGVGAGPVVIVTPETELSSFPPGGVLVAAHSSPNYVIAFPHASAVVAQHGSVTGHMATLCREFQVPSIVGALGALNALVAGEIVTVDADTGRVFVGIVDEVLSRQRQRAPRMTGTPVYTALRNAADIIIPLNLTDPKSPAFSPQHCRTVHDIMRYIHERTYHEMFRVGDMATDSTGAAVKLRVRLPIDLYVLDLGGGLQLEGRHRSVGLEQVTSRPFKALLEGLLDDKVQQTGPRPVDMRGFFSVMSQQALSPSIGAERFGERSYAIVSDKYLNFSSRVGYHYGIVDCYCGNSLHNNYITFEFKGGAADDLRRARRARSIGLILERIGFNVEIHADRAAARLAKYAPEEIEERLVQLGRLLIFTRQMDMLMTTEASIEAMANCFFSGNYHCDFAAQLPQS